MKTDNILEELKPIELELSEALKKGDIEKAKIARDKLRDFMMFKLILAGL
jgi:hypothetical protein